MSAIIKSERTPDPREAYIAYMFACYLRAPARPTKAEINRSRAQGIEPVFDLGELGEIRDKAWSRATVYSPAQLENK